jgi:hypothetical protein
MTFSLQMNFGTIGRLQEQQQGVGSSCYMKKNFLGWFEKSSAELNLAMNNQASGGALSACDA